MSVKGVNKENIRKYALNEFLTEYKILNADNKYRPVAVGRYGIRKRESIYSKELAKDYSKNKLIYKNTLTVGMGSKQIDIGILTEDEVFAVSPAYHTYEIQGIRCKYLEYCLRSKNIEMFSLYAKRGSRQGKSIDLKRWLTYKIPVYSEEDQIVIEDNLNKINVVIELRRKQLELLDELVRARFMEMFGDPIQNSKGYPIRQFSDYIISLTSGSRGWAKYCVDDGKEWFITIKNVKDCHIITDNIQPIDAPSNAEAKRTKVEEGDLLISITADLGRTGVVTKEVAEHGAYINQHLSCIRIDREILNPLYVAYYMESPAGKRQFMQKNQSAVKAGLNFNSINSLKLLVPPMEEQNKFIRFVKQIDKSRLLNNHLLFLLKSITF